MSFVNGKLCTVCETLHPAEPGMLFTCPECGGNLEITYDYEALSEVLTREALAQRPVRGILRFLPLLPVSDPAHYPNLEIGSTPLVAPGRLRERLGLPQLFIKDDSRNPSASFKDRASAIALAHAREQGAEVVCAASTGNAGSSMACLSASVGQRCVIFVPRSAPRAKVAQLLLFGAEVLAVDGTYDDAFDLSLKVSEAYGWYNRNTGTNPYTREGKKTSALEMAEQLGWQVPDQVFVPVGDGNIISGIWKGFRDLKACGLIDRLPRIVAVQSEGSAAIVRTLEKLSGRMPEGGPKDIELVTVSATTLADSISVDLPRDGVAAVRAVLESGGQAVEVSDEAILEAMKDLAASAGVFAEPAAATAWAGLTQLKAAGGVKPEETQVVLITGNGLKDVNSALKAAGEPRVIPPTLEAVKELL